MLREMYIKNFVLIDEIRLELHDGLNVLTGETGAGKSIIIDALSLIMGDRFKSDYIRDASCKTVVEAVFEFPFHSEAYIYLSEQDLVDENEPIIIISREISPQGRSSARINGRNVTAAVLKTLAGYIIDMHLQHDHLAILKPDKFLSYVDSFSPDSGLLLKRVRDCYIKLKNKLDRLDDLYKKQQDKLQRQDFLEFQIRELEEANLKPGEDEELEALHMRIKNAHDLMEGSAQVINILYDNDGNSAYDQVAAALDTVRKLSEEELFSSLVTELEEIYFSLQDITMRVSAFKDSLDFEPGLLEKIDDRLHEIYRLKNKYGRDIDGMLEFLAELRQEWEVLNNSQEKQEELEKEIADIRKEYFQLAGKLTEVRKKGAQILQDHVHKELEQLSMPHIRFAVKIDTGERLSIIGLDEADFLFAPNPGEPLRPLARIASGGEISRFILALKKALADAYNVPTLIFDEIDVGVGGTALGAMAFKLKELADRHQIILVTHSPQIASYADTHFLIEKHVQGESTNTTVTKLDEQGKIKELARMLGGDHYTGITLQHAREMLANANKNR